MWIGDCSKRMCYCGGFEKSVLGRRLLLMFFRKGILFRSRCILYSKVRDNSGERSPCECLHRLFILRYSKYYIRRRIILLLAHKDVKKKYLYNKVLKIIARKARRVAMLFTTVYHF